VIASQGRVTLIQLSGRWRDRLRKLPAPYDLSRSTADGIIQLIEQNPLPMKKGLSGWRELGPYNVNGKTELTYTNHHYFLTAWVITPVDEVVPEHEILDYDKLGAFYREGRGSLHAGLTCSFRLPQDLKVIYQTSPMPDVVIHHYFRGQLKGVVR
jgi:hypothetical protein